MMSRTLFCWLLLALLVAFGSAVQAQDGQGRVEGAVVRESGQGVGGVTVVVVGTDVVALSEDDGTFLLTHVPSGTQSIEYTLVDNVATQEVEIEAGATSQVEMTIDWDVTFAETIVVVSASRRPERIVEAPAAITRVTEIEIERQASHGQLPKLLEFTPGAQITASGVYDYNLNTRGFNSSLNRRVQTIIDGRNPSVPFLGAQEWGGLSFPLDDLSGVEFVRGPSAALYGSNASSGVLNMITKGPRGSEGGLVRITGGELSTLNADLRWATHLGSDWYLKLTGGVRTHGDFAVSRNGAAEYSVPCTSSGQTDCLPQEAKPLDPLDDDKIYLGGLRVDKHFGGGGLLTLEGGTANIEGPVFQTGIGRVQVVESDRPWARVNYNTVHWNALGSYTKRDAPKQTALSAGTNVSLDSERLAFEVQGNYGFASDRGQIIGGFSYSEEDIDSFDPDQNAQTLMFGPQSDDFQAIFAQLEWSFTDKLRLVLAGRYDESSLYDSQFSPKGSLVYSVNASNTLRLSYNESFQSPNYSEFFLQANAAPPVNLQPFEAFCAPFGVSCGFAPGPTRVLALGNKDLTVEEVKAWEVGYSGILGRKAFLTVDYYNSENTNFITDLLPQLGTSLGRINPNYGPYMPPDSLPDPVAQALLAALRGALGASFFILSNNLDGTPILAGASYTNFGDVDTQGVDVGLNFYVSDAWTFMFTYSWFDYDIKDAAPDVAQLLLPNSPENAFSTGLGYATPKWDLNGALRWVDDFRWVTGPFQGNVESYTVVDLIGNYRINDSFSLGVNVANLLDEEHWESFGGDLMGRRALASVTFSWR